MYKGDEVLLYIEVDNSFVPIGCLTSNSMDESSEIIESASTSSFGYRNYKTNLQSFSVSFDGVVTNNVYSLNDLKQAKRNRALNRYRIATLDGKYQDTFKAYVSNITEAANIGEEWTFSGSLKGTGVPLFISQGDGGNWIFLDGSNVVDLNGDNLKFIQ